MNKKPTKSGGRVKGTPNKKTTELAERANALGVDPFEVLCLFAMGDWKALGYKEEKYMTQSNDHGDFYKYTIDPAVRAKCAAEAAGYLYPKRKAVEHSSDPENPVGVSVSFSKEVVEILTEFKDLIGKVHQ